MNHDDKKPEPREEPPRRRLPYERPAVISEEIFETLALSCQRTIGCTPANRS
jgi:hypothetical protein